MIKIETDRLILRPFTIDDIIPAYELNLDPEVTRYTGDGGVVSFEEMERRIKEDVIGDYKKRGFGRFAVDDKETQEFIGFAGLKYLDDMSEVDLGYRFKKSYWGKGIATEAGMACVDFAFSQLNLNKIIALVLPDNKASIRVLHKLNFCFDKVIMENGLSVQKFELKNDI